MHSLPIERKDKTHRMIIALICCVRRSPKVTLITVFVSIVAWKQARWPPLFITFLISPYLVTSTYQVSSEIYGGIFYQGITLSQTLLAWRLCTPSRYSASPRLSMRGWSVRHRQLIFSWVTDYRISCLMHGPRRRRLKLGALHFWTWPWHVQWEG